MANVSSSNSQGELVPRLRFPGFEGEWEAKELGDLLMFQNGINAPAEKYGKGIKYISVMDILNNTFITYDRIRGLVDIDDQTLKNYSVEYGDIVFQRSSETPEDIGHSNVYLDDRTATFGGFVIRGKKTGDYNPLFFKYLLDSGTARKEIIRIGQGAQHYNIGQEGLRKISLYFPKESEQKKIARILELIDTNIGLHTALIMALKSYKRGLIRKLLTPDRSRLDGDKWTYITIGELGKFVKGAPLSKADISAEGDPFILYGELYTTYGEVITSVIRKTNAKVDPVYYSKVGDVIIPTSGETPEEISTASCVMVPNAILAGDLNIFRTNLVDGRILSYILNHIANWQIARIAQGKSVVHIQASELSQIEIAFPDSKEQARIVSVISGLDRIVSKNEDILEKLTMVKDALLQQLFV